MGRKNVVPYLRVAASSFVASDLDKWICLICECCWARELRSQLLLLRSSRRIT